MLSAKYFLELDTPLCLINNKLNISGEEIIAIGWYY